MRAIVLWVMLLFFAPSVLADDAVLVDAVAARVDDKVILVSDVRERAHARIARGDVAGRAMRTALEELIDATLVTKEAKRLHIDVTPEEMKRARASVATQNGVTDEQLSAEIRKQGMTDASWEAIIREQLFEGKLLSVAVANSGHPRPTKPEEYEAWAVKERDAMVKRLRAAATIEVRL